MQEAYSAWTGHRLRCHGCRDIDAGACDAAEALWRTYNDLADAAYRQVRTAGSQATG
ncbi:hypothetical protein [Streptomyces sp. NPDC006610]|uniref:hypothetical protein n=1 Tax=Streptomyces sp. NPDC006610 TaxID=3154584 RepID=UPI0033ACC40F